MVEEIQRKRLIWYSDEPLKLQHQKLFKLTISTVSHMLSKKYDLSQINKKANRSCYNPNTILEEYEG